MPTTIDLTSFFESLNGNTSGGPGLISKIKAELDVISGEASSGDTGDIGMAVAADTAPDLNNATLQGGADLEGNQFINIIVGDGGNNVLIGREGVDILLGSAGIDTVDYSYSTESSVFVDLANRFAFAGEGDVDILGSIENAIGTENADILLGDAFNNVFAGNGGDDFIYGREGVDVAQFVGQAEQFTIAQTQDGLGINVTGPDGSTSTLYGIEFLQFCDPSEDGEVHMFTVGTNGNGGDTIARDDGYDADDNPDGTPICVDEDSNITIDVLSNDEFIGVVAQKLLGLEGGVDQGDGTYAVEGDFGSLIFDTNVLDANGEPTITYVTDERADALNVGEIGNENFEYIVTGGDAADIYIQVKGTNDAPVCIAETGNPIKLCELKGDDCHGVLDQNVLQGGTAKFVIFDPDNDLGDIEFAIAQNENGDPKINISLSPDGEIDLEALPPELYPTITDAISSEFSQVGITSEPGNYEVQVSVGILDSALDFLSLGETLHIEYTIEISDGSGGVLEKTVNVQIQGANDGPIATECYVVDAPIAEDGDVFSATLGSDEFPFSLLATDPDLNDELTSESFSFADGSINICGEDISFDDLSTIGVDYDSATGAFTIDPSAAIFQQLGENEAAEIQVNFDVTDSVGCTDTGTIKFTVDGTNGTPEVADVCVGDSTDTAGPNSQQDTSGNVYEDCGLGGYSGDGKTYVDPGNQLAGVSGDALIRDGEEADVSQGPNNGLVINEIGGSENASDEDKNDTLTIVEAQPNGSDISTTVSASGVTTITGVYGTLYLEANGAYTYTLYQNGDDGYATLNALGQGDTASENFTFTVSDGTSGDDSTTTAQLKFTVVGSNDEPTIADTMGMVTEDTDVEGGMLSSNGSVAIDDVDIGDTFTIDGVIAPDDALGTFTPTINNESGELEWTFEVENSSEAVQTLGLGQSIVQEYQVIVSDGTECACATVTITIKGTNDQPELDDVCVGTGIVDNPFDGAATNGNLNAESNGNVFEDGRPRGDEPLPARVGGNLLDDSKASDIDQGDVLSFCDASFDGEMGGLNNSGNHYIVRGEYGVLRIDPDSGDYVYILYPTEDGDGNTLVRGETLNALSEGQVVMEEFDFSITDNSGATGPADGEPAKASATIKFTVVGTNDLPVLTGDDPICVMEDDLGADESDLVATGTVTIDDVDANDTHTVTVTDGNDENGENDNVGSLSAEIDENGNVSYTYTAPNAADEIQCLGEGETRTETFEITVNDGTEDVTETITVIIKGTNDRPEVDDVCVGNPDVANAGPTAPYDSSGNVYEDCGLAYPQGDGKTFADFGNQSASVWGDALVTEGDDANASDVDKNDILSITQVQVTGSEQPATEISTDDDDPTMIMGTYGTLFISADGSYHYALDAGSDNPMLNGLAHNEQVSESFTFTVSDNSGAANATTTAVLKFNVVGTNDEPTVADSNGMVVEEGTTNDDGELEVSGTSVITDADIGDDHTVVLVENDNVGTLVPVVDESGNVSWTFTVDNEDPAVQCLGEGDVLVQTFTIQVSDGLESACAAVTITIKGTNDQPVVDDVCIGELYNADDVANAGPGANVDHSGNLYEDCGLGGESGDGKTYVDPGNQFAAVSGDALVMDGEDADEFGSNPFPNLAVNDIGGNENASDVDKNDALTVTNVQVAGNNESSMTVSVGAATVIVGTYGTLHINANGSYTYALDAGGHNEDLNSLGHNDLAAEEFTFTVADDSGADNATTTAQLKFTIVGSNDEPILESATGSVQEDTLVTDDGDLVTTGTMGLSDADSGDVHTIDDIDPVGGAIGTITFVEDADGNLILDENGNAQWTYTVDNSSEAIQCLGEGETLNVTFNVTISDGLECVCAPITITIEGTNADPVVNDVCIGDPEAADAGPGDSSETDLNTASGNVYEDCGLDGSGGDFGNRFSSVRGDALVTSADNDDTPSDGGDGFVSQSVGAGEINATDEDKTDVLTIVEVQSGEGDDAVTEEVPQSGYTTIQGTYGTLQLAANGGYTYTLHTAANGTDYNALNGLQHNEVVAEDFLFTVSDGNGGSDTATLKFTVVGTNDEPIVEKVEGSVTQIADADDQSYVQASGTQTIQDADIGDTHYVGYPGDEPDDASDPVIIPRGDNLGSLTASVNGDGELVWNYSVIDSAIQGLDDGEFIIETFKVPVSDGVETTLVDVCIKVNGTNDSPTAVKLDLTDDNALSEGQLGDIGTSFNLESLLNVQDVDNQDVGGMTADGSGEGMDEFTFSNLGDENDSMTVTLETLFPGCGIELELPLGALIDTGLVDFAPDGTLSIPAEFASVLSELMEDGDLASIRADVEISDGTATITEDICVDIDGASAQAEPQPDYGKDEGQISPEFLIACEPSDDTYDA